MVGDDGFKKFRKYSSKDDGTTVFDVTKVFT